MSSYGFWSLRDQLPTFIYTANQNELTEAEWEPLIGPPTRRHWIVLGNQRLKLYAANDGGVALFDEGHGLRWLTDPMSEGTGHAIIDDSSGVTWGTGISHWPSGVTPRRIFGPSTFTIETEHEGLSLERSILCPSGEIPWLLIRVRLSAGAHSRAFRYSEQWSVQPQFVSIGGTPESRTTLAREAVTFTVTRGARSVRAAEQCLRSNDEAASGWGEVMTQFFGPSPRNFQQLFGPPLTLHLEALGHDPDLIIGESGPTPTLEAAVDLRLAAGEMRELWFRFGIDDGSTVADPAALFATSLTQLAAQLPTGQVEVAPEARRELPWHAAMLLGSLCADQVIGGHTLNQGSFYAYINGFNAAARDPLQHALPLVYFAPQYALSVLRNTCAWATPEGDLVYALDGAKQPFNELYQPSDQNLWALWLAAEYAAATGDIEAFDQPLAYHPVYQTPAITLRDHLRRQFRYFVDQIGRGSHGHVRLRNADWNDGVLTVADIDRQLMIASGESVLNSAMAAWVLPIFAGLCARLKESELEREARELGEDLRQHVAAAWNGSHVDRAYAPDGQTIGGAGDLWLEVQPWAIISDALDTERSRALLATIWDGPGAASPLGARIRWPLPTQTLLDSIGEGITGGGIWFAINMPLLWATALHDNAAAWDAWRRITLDTHMRHYPDVWEGTISGPDAYNAPESSRPGRTFMGMQAFPVNNLHSHAQPLLAYLRLLGVAPTAHGTLQIGGGATWHSRTFGIDSDGHGYLLAHGPVTLETKFGTVRGGPGKVVW